jgi:Anti-sigma-K factor rskA
VPHLDPNRLVLIALGEQDPSAFETEHLRGCGSCDADLAATQATITVGRESEHLRNLPAPSEDLWTRIAGAAFTAPSPQDGRLGRAEKKTRRHDTPAGTRWFSSLPNARGRSRPALAAAAVLLVAVVGVAVTWSSHRTTERILAKADLVAQPAAPAAARGRATIVDTGHGLQMRLVLSGMPAPTGYYTVWLYDGRTVMIPIGSPGPAPLNVPAAADDLTKFSIVDVSAQQLGQQQHGTSMLQGRLRS